MPAIQRFLDKNSYIGVLRLKRDIGTGSNIGLLLTSYNFIEKHNQLGGIDWRFKISKQKTLTFQVLATTSRQCFQEPALDTHRPGPSEGCFAGFDSTSSNPSQPLATRNYYRTGNGLAYSVSYNRDGRHFYYGFNGNGQTRDYLADVGFTRRTNTNFEGVYAGYNSEPKPKAKLISWSVNSNAGMNFNWQGLSQQAFQDASVSFNFQHNTYLGIGTGIGYERLFEEQFGVKRTATHAGAFFGGPERSTYQVNPYLYARTHPSKKYSLNLNIYNGFNSFDFDFGAAPKYPRVSPAALADPSAPLDPGPGTYFELDLSGDYKPTNGLDLSPAIPRTVCGATTLICLLSRMTSILFARPINSRAFSSCGLELTMTRSPRMCAASFFLAGRQIPARLFILDTITISLATVSIHSPASLSRDSAVTAVRSSSNCPTSSVAAMVVSCDSPIIWIQVV